MKVAVGATLSETVDDLNEKLASAIELQKKLATDNNVLNARRSAIQNYVSYLTSARDNLVVANKTDIG